MATACARTPMEEMSAGRRGRKTPCRTSRSTEAARPAGAPRHRRSRQSGVPPAPIPSASA